MKRIMHKVIDAGKYVRYVPVNGLQAYRKLGKIEDLMEKYNIDSVEELEEILQRLTINTFKIKSDISEKDYETLKKALEVDNE